MRPSDQHGIQLAEAVHKPHKGWRACWGKLHCFASPSRKRDRRHPRLLHAPSSANPSSNGNIQISEPMPSSSSISPLVHAPPPSPASLSYIENLPSPAALLTLFPLKCVDDLCSDATPRGYSSFRGLDPVLVTPPLHSTLTTEPTTPLSTAPFTPPPELAHLTTPPSPEVPFAELVASSLSVKCAEQLSDQTSTIEASIDPTNFEIGYRLYSRNPVTISEASSTEAPSPLPERVPFLQGSTGSAAITSLLERASPFGFNQATTADEYGHCSPELIYQHVPHDEGSQHVQVENTLLRLQSDALCSGKHLQNDDVAIAAEHSYEQGSKEQQALQVLNNGYQRRQSEISEPSSANCAQVLEDSYCKNIEDGPGFFSTRNLSEGNIVLQPNDSKRGLECNANQTTLSYTSCCVERQMDGIQCAQNCSTCGLLTSKCGALLEALHETKEKLSLIEEKGNMFDDRDTKCKQIFEWLQLEARSQQASIARLSEELSWQDEAFLDLQTKYLAELGVELPLSSAELPSKT
ncbi:hypothetical protein GOP47_0013381 [Adiantum capillus-veneris]|uniref:Uncharacterized protein n=1 Tax=Adiantum capillus-veneris TaxID=13818 RepID=A0A9D4UNE1_ADICA|nr:hypothetical protein GOP47_0013381 [Adiantum capillus-veneris]